MSLLDLQAGRPESPPRDAATILWLRPGSGTIEIFCVERHKSSGFLGGAIVFPGGKLEPRDRDPAWDQAATPFTARACPEDDPAAVRALAIAACRESLEEAAILPLVGNPLSHDELLTLRAALAGGGEDLLAAVTRQGLQVDLSPLRIVSRWVTPVAEARRFDTRFFLAVAPANQRGAHDQYETMHSFWATPSEVLRRFDAGEIQLAPPTHRMLELLSPMTTAAAALAWADSTSLLPICPSLVEQPVDASNKTVALVLPGDPEHVIGERRILGRTRFVLRDGRFLPEDPPR